MDGWTIVTGASGAMGSEAVKALAGKGVPVIMACRNLEKAEVVRQRILSENPEANLRIEEIHLDSRKSIMDFIDRIKDENITGLFNNAGTMERHFSVTEDGFERTLAVNYVGPYLLTMSLIPYLKAGAHIVNMVSLSCEVAQFDRDIFTPDKRKFSQLGSYSTSKLALLFFSIDLARQHPELKVNMSDPGIVDSEMIRLHRWFDPLTDVLFRPFCNSPRKGVAPAVRAMSSEESGKLFVGDKCKTVRPKYLERTEEIEWLREKSTGLF